MGVVLVLPSEAITEPGIGLTVSGITAATRDRSGNLTTGIGGIGWIGPAPHGPRCRVKRAVDVAGTVLGLIKFLPVIALWIRLDSPGPALFREVHRGHPGRPFRMFMFRTLVVDAQQ
jgi:hypothetical protein